jgi:hypothetical protein
VVPRHLGELPPEGTLARADDAPRGGHAVRLGDRRRVRERAAEGLDLGVEVRVQRELLGNDERRDEHDPCAAVRREAAGEIERVLRLGAAEERHDDASVPDRRRAPGEAVRLPAERAEVRLAHHRIW